MARNRTKGAGTQARSGSKAASAASLPGLRWVPVPLALLFAAIGWLMLGGAVGQHAASAAAKAEQGFDAGGLQAQVTTMMWMSNDMTGQGPVKNKNPNGYKMPTSMMPGLQLAGNDRLRIELDISNISSKNQQYYVRAFRIVTKNGQSYGPNNNDGSTQPTTAILRPGFGTIIDLYFDLPAGATKNLTVEWTHAGQTTTFPVDTNGTVPAPHIH